MSGNASSYLERKDFTRIPGILVGLVHNNQDPEGLGRVKVKLPILGDKVITDWAPVASFWASGSQSGGGQQNNRQGAFFLPEVSDQVLVAFENGNVNKPYVIGSIWSKVDKPIVAKDDQRHVREIKTKRGNVIRLDERKGQEKIQITDKNDNEIVIDTKKNKITLSSTKDIELQAPKGKILLKAKEIEAQASTTIKMDAKTKMEMKSSASMKLDSQKVDVKGTQVNVG